MFDIFIFRIFLYPSFDEPGEVFKTASFTHIIELFEMESKMPAKIAYKLKHRTLFPGPIERQSVQLTHAVFHESTVQALQFYGKKGRPHFLDTAKFVALILKWWKTVNAKNKFTASQKLDPDREVISSINLAEKTSFLRGFVDWLCIWEAKSGPKHGLSVETFQAAKHSTSSLAEIAEYLLEKEDFSYVPLGKYQSDPLEGKFGQYRQMNGGNLFASVKQIVESERCLKIKNLAKLNLSLSDIKDIFSSVKIAKNSKNEEVTRALVASLVSDNRIELEPEIPDADRNILFYVAGSFGRKIADTKNCEDCKNLLVDTTSTAAVIDDMDNSAKDSSILTQTSREFLDQVNRGGLSIPSEFVFLVCAHIWDFYSSIMKEPFLKDLLHSENISSRSVFTEALLSYLDSCEETRNTFILKNCEKGHQFCEVVRVLAQKLFNLFSKNHTLFMNSEIHRLKRKRVDSLANQVKRDTVSLKVKKLQSD